MDDNIKIFNSVADPFFIESIEAGTDMSTLEYHRNGEEVYADGRQVMSRSCHDILISYPDLAGQKGILLINRKAEPARSYLWPIGGFYDRGILTPNSIASRVKNESGLEINKNSLLILGSIRMMWKTTPNKNAEAKGLPLGIDDNTLLWYAEGKGELFLDKLHENPLIVTSEMYTKEFRGSLHPYIQMGMDRAIKLI